MKFFLSQNTLQEHKVSVKKKKRKKIKALFKSQCNTIMFPVVVRNQVRLSEACEQGTVGNSS